MPIEPINPIRSGLTTPTQVGRTLGGSSVGLQQSLQRIASGLRLTSPSVDPAGLAQSINLEAEISRIGAAQSNINNAISFAQTQEGNLQLVSDALNRMGELSIRAQDFTLSEGDRANLSQEFSRLQSFIGSASSQEFNVIPLFTTDDLKVTVGANGETMTMEGINLAAPASEGGVGDVISSATSIATPVSAAAAVDAIQAATQNIGDLRARIGANLQRLSVSGENLSVLSINLNAANGRIVASDLATESANLSQNQALVNSALMAFTQANRVPRAGISSLT